MTAPHIMVLRDPLVILALWGGGLGAAGQYAKFSAVFDLLPQVYPQAGAGIGLAVSMVGLLGIALGGAAGLAVARIRYRRALLWALWLGAGVSAVQALLPPFGILLALRAVEGLSHLGLVVAAPTLIAQLCPPRHRGLALTLWGSFFGVAYAIMALAAPPLLGAGGVSALFAAHALYMALFALILGTVLRSLPGAPPPPMTLGLVLADHAAIYRSPRIAAPAAGWLFYTFCYVAILTVLPPHLPDSVRAATMAAMPLAGIATSMTAGVALLRVLPAVRVVEAGFALSALCALSMLLTPVSPLACIALAAALGLVQGASFAAVAQLNADPGDQARANGAMAQTGNLGNTLGTPVIAAAMSAFGYPALPVLAAAVLAAGCVAHVMLGRARGS